MLFGKALLTTFTFAAMAITHVASAPTAQPEISILERQPEFSIIERTGSLTDKMNTCYNNVQYKCDDIYKKIDAAKGVVDVKVAASIKVDLEAIIALVVAVVADIKLAIKTAPYEDVRGCGTKFVLLVKLLTTVLLELASVCTPSALSLLAAIVLKLKVNINLCASLLTSAIDLLITGLLSIVVNLLKGLKIDIIACIKLFVGACSKYPSY